MIRKVFIGISFFASAMTSFYILMFIIKESDQEKFLCGYMLLAGGIFGLCMWLFELARTRDERKRKIRKHKERRENEIRETNSRRN